ncbi:MAG: hypothetical protein JW889_02745 [Verrucomicrobia bacterium]|nr:hypothetical protein [Verrucomicrobiota bacterium]
MGTKGLVVAAALMLAGSSVAASQAEPKPEEIQVPILVRTDWTLVKAPEDNEAPGRISTAAAIAVCRALEAKTKAAYDGTNKVPGCDPADLRRAFYLNKAEFLLGEPILVELRVQLDGPGTWQEWRGGNYRARGRDDNCLVLLRHEDGTWVTDPYAPIQWYMGGLGSSAKVERAAPSSSWLAVQRWCAVSRPGTYDLHCLHADHAFSPITGRAMAMFDALPERVKDGHYVRDDGALIDIVTGDISTQFRISTLIKTQGEAESPVLAKIPNDVVARAKENTWSIEHVTDYAHFRIVIIVGTDAERREMTARWTKVASEPDDGRSMHSRTKAAREAVQFVQQDDFLPLIAKWITDEGDKDWNSFTALAMHPGGKATELLLTCEPLDVLRAMYRLRRDKIADFIPHLIQWLASDDAEVRYWADWCLTTWTGEEFGHTWEGNPRERPTLDEGKAMQPAWREWWADNKDGFKPVDRRNQ